MIAGDSARVKSCSNSNSVTSHAVVADLVVDVTAGLAHRRAVLHLERAALAPHRDVALALAEEVDAHARVVGADRAALRAVDLAQLAEARAVAALRLAVLAPARDLALAGAGPVEALARVLAVDAAEAARRLVPAAGRAGLARDDAVLAPQRALAAAPPDVVER